MTKDYAPDVWVVSDKSGSFVFSEKNAPYYEGRDGFGVARMVDARRLEAAEADAARWREYVATVFNDSSLDAYDAEGLTREIDRRIAARQREGSDGTQEA